MLIIKNIQRAQQSLLSLTVFLFAMVTAGGAFGQSFSTVAQDLSINIPAVQVDSDFYHVVLVPIPDTERWQVAIADDIDAPEFISARVTGEQLSLLCLNFEGATYMVELGLVDPEAEPVLFDVLEVTDISDDNACSTGIEPGAFTGEAAFDPELQFSKYTIGNGEAREALCNDGSVAAFYYRPSQTASASWKIHLQGGGSCSTEADCQLRTTVTAEMVAGNAELDIGEVFLPFTSSLEYPDMLDLEGVFSLDLEKNPTFGTFNHVYIPYCSSDSHYGDRSASEETFGLHFKGAKIIQAVIEDLLDSSVIGENNLQHSDRVVVSGTSAGGRGVQQNLDRIADMIPHENVFGVLDSSYFTRFFLTEEERIGLALRESNLWNGQYDNSCTDFLGTADKHLCDRVELMFDYIEAPIFVHMDQLDEVAIGPNTDRADEFAEHTRQELQGLCGIFSGQFGYHGAIRSDEAFFDSIISGFSYHDLLVNWLTGDDASVKSAITDSVTLTCTP